MDGVQGNGMGALTLTQFDEMTHSLELFTRPRKEVAVLGYRQLSCAPVNLTDDNPLEFNIPVQSTAFLQFSSCRLFAECRIVTEDDKLIGGGWHDGDDDDDQSLDWSNESAERPPPKKRGRLNAVGGSSSSSSGSSSETKTGADDARDAHRDPFVSLVNSFPTACFQTFDVDINNSPVTELSCALFPYKCYTDALCSYGYDGRSSHLQTSLWASDTPDEFDSVDPARNHGLAARSVHCAKSRKFQFYTPLTADFTMCDRFIPPGMVVRIRLTRSKNAFSLMTNHPEGRYKVKFERVRLYFNAINVDNTVTELLMRKWSKEPVLFPMNKSHLKNYIVTAGKQTVDIGQVFMGPLPRQLVLGMVSQRAFVGDYGLSPFNFQHFNASSVSIKVNSQTTPQEPWSPNFEDNLFARELGDFYVSCGIKNDNVTALKIYIVMCLPMHANDSIFSAGLRHHSKHVQGRRLPLGLGPHAGPVQRLPHPPRRIRRNRAQPHLPRASPGKYRSSRIR
jgi:hypothetical protein